MAKTAKSPRKEKRVHGKFTLPGGQVAAGVLALNGEETLLRTYSESFLRPVEAGEAVRGTSYSGECITLIDCRNAGSGHVGYLDGDASYTVDVFPHYVAMGRLHLEADALCIQRVHFGTRDLETVFWDVQAFGHVLDSRSVIDAVLEQAGGGKKVMAGRAPQVVYFTGNDCIADVETMIGRITAHHRPRFNLGGARGVYIRSRVEVSIEFPELVSFGTAMDRAYVLGLFLSVAAGRTQEPRRIRVNVAESGAENSQSLEILPSFGWRSRPGKASHGPHPSAMPLDPVRRPEEFSKVLIGWIERHEGWKFARGQFLGCQRQGNSYGPDRLVAAANMFDILPSDASPDAAGLDDEVSKARDSSVAMFRSLRSGAERDSALSALGRLGKPSLPKKVRHRCDLLRTAVEGKYADLEWVLATAVRLRNFYVHGSTEGIDPETVEPHIAFLTDALEFVFCASDLAELGWDAKRWVNDAGSWGHPFGQFHANFDIGVARLRAKLPS